MANSVETHGERKVMSALLTRNFGNIDKTYEDDQVIAIRPYAFFSALYLNTVNCPKAKKIGKYAFNSVATSSVILPWDKITEVGDRAFYGSSSAPQPHCQTELNMGSLKTVGEYAFSLGGSGRSGNNPLLKFTANVLEDVPTGMLRYQEGLTYVRLPKVKTIGAAAFNGCKALDTFIMDQVTEVPAIPAVSVFTRTKMGDNTGFFYVPGELLRAFQIAPYWETFSARFRAIEDYPELLQ